MGKITSGFEVSDLGSLGVGEETGNGSFTGYGVDIGSCRRAVVFLALFH